LKQIYGKVIKIKGEVLKNEGGISKMCVFPGKNNSIY
jgi:hypothetical protein